MVTGTIGVDDLPTIVNDRESRDADRAGGTVHFNIRNRPNVRAHQFVTDVCEAPASEDPGTIRSARPRTSRLPLREGSEMLEEVCAARVLDRKSTRLNSSHV